MTGSTPEREWEPRGGDGRSKCATNQSNANEIIWVRLRSAKSRWSSNLQYLLTDNMLYQNHPESLNLISESASVPPKLAKLKSETKSKQRKSATKDPSGHYGGSSSSVVNRYLVVQQEKFSCQNCERVYKNKDSLGRHLKWECGKEPSFPCSRCPYKARYKADLLRHEKTRHLKREANPFAGDVY
ncbi:hypothetical protein RUM43_014732 [Polyplax serrata]|uniref:C2H2-type domain-containing protein n=1 Tax=Polyplax serrata TaxID=468196 RepID=A0AAN8P168_POLSC